MYFIRRLKIFWNQLSENLMLISSEFAIFTSVPYLKFCKYIGSWSLVNFAVPIISKPSTTFAFNGPTFNPQILALKPHPLSSFGGLFIFLLKCESASKSDCNKSSRMSHARLPGHRLVFTCSIFFLAHNVIATIDSEMSWRMGWERDSHCMRTNILSYICLNLILFLN